MLSDSVVKSLNRQINLEFYSSNLYLQMSSWCGAKGFEGSAAFLQLHSDEEMDHMRRLFTYVNETGAMALLGTVAAPPTEFVSLVDVFRETYQHECTVTKEIGHLVDAALADKDYSTFQFLQWYVAEQHEEEALFKSILDKIELIGADGKGLYFIDQEIRQMATQKTTKATPPTQGM